MEGIRERKARPVSEHEQPPEDNVPSQHARAQTGWPVSRLLYTLVLLLSTVLYLFWKTNPGALIRLIEPWYDLSEQLPGVSSPEYAFLGADEVRRDAVVDAFKHAWFAYERDAMGDDEYHPLSHKGSNLTDAGGIGYTVVDSLDTMIIMGLDEEYRRARSWVDTKLTFEVDGIFNVFETTIRVLGGLLSAYHLTHDSLYIDRAKDLADRLMVAFSTPSGLPVAMVNLGTRTPIPDTGNQNLVSTAEVATLQLELRYLTELTDDDSYWRAAEKVMQVIRKAVPVPPLAAIYMDPQQGTFVTSPIRLGSRGDSYYEYLLKQYLQTGRVETGYREMYDGAMDAIHEHLVQRTPHTNFLYTAELMPERTQTHQMQWRLVPKQDHLVCFLGGSLMLGATDGGHFSVPPRAEEFVGTARRDWTTGYELIKTCMETHRTHTGLSPEIAHFRTKNDPQAIADLAPNDWYIKGSRQPTAALDARYILRPETVESLFIAFRLTGDSRYRDWGWQIFQSIEKHCKVPTGGYAGVTNVDIVPPELEDKMETFMMSETLKYLYLLFSDSSILPLTENVFNTEAHPFPIIRPTGRTAFT
ncbi:glycoside hydrolase [Sistotremastrum niveocremeum HHB9708]|uniref:alpha-1,2-Mannosidase n=1 Tax=Sistotremastrum niveocremeum HHB9708 TaxID=1314777 RepID=A0A164USW7_9AGAM|nr:glycoside hydrolase [Sistotremastrum niveocremeum HHB9708]